MLTLPRCLALLLVLVTSTVALGAEADERLSAERWRETAFGVSLQPPRDAVMLGNLPGGALVGFEGVGYRIEVHLRTSDQALDMDWIRNQTSLEVSYGSRAALLIDETERRIGNRPGLLSFFNVEDRRSGEAWVFGQGVMKIDPHTLALVQLRSTAETFEENRSLFEAVIDSVDILHPTELDRVRSAWVQSGARWHQGVDREALEAALKPEQWYRVVEGQKDVGYLRVRQSLAEESGLAGIRVDVDSRLINDERTIDTLSFFFESDDGQTELWSVRTSQRRTAPPSTPAPRLRGQEAQGQEAGPVHTSEETGLRSGSRITVSRTLPTKVDNLEWAMPPEGYVSQARLHLLPRLFPRGTQHDFAFYAYDSRSGKMVLRSVQVFPTEDGYMVRERDEARAQQQISFYDPQGNLLERQTPDGRVILPTTLEKITEIWGIKRTPDTQR